MTTHTFTLLGNGPYYNRGCEAIVRGTVATLQREKTQLKFNSIYLTNNLIDKHTETDMRITHYPVREMQRFSRKWAKHQLSRAFPALVQAPNIFTEFRESLRKAGPSGATLLLGGDNATIHKGRQPQYAFEMVQLAKQAGTPVIYWGASIGPFSQYPEFEEWAIRQLQDVDLICARETETYNYLQSVGLVNNILLVADPSFNMHPIPCILPTEIESILSAGCIGLNFSPLVGDFYTSISEWTLRATRCIEYICTHYDGNILLIPHVVDNGNYNRNDRLFMQDVLNLLQDKYRKRVHLLANTLNAAQTKWVIGRTRIFAGCRSHSTFAAISMRVPTICISYSAKARGIAFDTYDHHDWLINGHDIDPEAFSDKVMLMYSQEDSIREHLQTRVPLFEERANLASSRAWALHNSQV